MAHTLAFLVAFLGALTATAEFKPSKLLLMEAVHNLWEAEIKLEAAVLRAETALAKLKRDEVIHAQNVRLFSQHAIAEFEYRESLHDVTRSRHERRESLLNVEQRRDDCEISRAHVREHKGEPVDTLAVLKVAAHQWKSRHEMTKEILGKAVAAVAFREFEYRMTAQLASQSAESQRRLVEARERYEAALAFRKFSEAEVAQTARMAKEAEDQAQSPPPSRS